VKTVSHPVNVAVIIPVYNDWEQLAQCLKALDQQSFPYSRFSIVVVNNGSNRPIKTALSCNSLLIACKTPGSYAARNAGISAVRADVYAFTDADCRPEPSWLSEAVTAFERSGRRDMLVAGSIKVTTKGSRLRPAELLETITAFPQERTVRQGYGVTANLFVHHSVFSVTGPFREDLKSGGDKEFCLRARNYGFRLKYCVEAVVQHPPRRYLSALISKERRVTGGRYSVVNGTLSRVLLLGRYLAPPVRTLKAILLDRQFSPEARLLATGALLWCRWEGIRELFRLIVLRRPARR